MPTSNLLYILYFKALCSNLVFFKNFQEVFAFSPFWTFLKCPKLTFRKYF
uniref:Uncharacterized protein n=1 Tax=viral metagenome TaxID=1070528 RepID=A0A6C0CQ17_9ZZZZ